MISWSGKKGESPAVVQSDGSDKIQIFGDLQLLDFVAAFFQQGQDAIRTGKMQRARNNCSRLAAFQFGYDPRDPFEVSLVNKARCNPWSLFPELRVPGPKCSGISFSPCFAHPVEIGCTGLGTI